MIGLTEGGLDRLFRFSRPRRGNMPLFKPGDAFYFINDVYDPVPEKGRVNYIRDDEKERRVALQYHYSVVFDDGTSEAYLPECFMVFEDEVYFRHRYPMGGKTAGRY